MISLLKKTLEIHYRKYILIIIQFTIAFFAMILSVCFLKSMLAYKDRTESIMKLDTRQISIVDEIDDTENEGEIKTVDPSQFEKSYTNIETIIEKNSEKIALFGHISAYTNEEEPINNAIMVNEGMIHMLNNAKKTDIYSILSGSSTEEEIPIIVGAAYKELFQEGKTYDLCVYENGERKEITVVVKKVLPPDEYIFTGNSTKITDTVESEGEFILFPNLYSMSSEAYENNILINDEDLLNQIEDEFLALGVNIESVSLEEQVQEYYKEQKKVVISTFLFSIILMLLSILGCTGTLLSNIIVRKKEFGVYYSLGLQVNKLTELVILEGGVIFGVSFLLSVLFGKIVEFMFLAKEKIYVTGDAFLLAFVIMGVCVIVCSVAPTKVINRLDPIELVNGSK